MHYRCTIADAATLTGAPAGTIRRWLAEGKLTRYGPCKPWRVELGEVERLRDTLTRRPA